VHISSERDFQGLHLDFLGTFFEPGILLTQGCGPNYGLPEKGSTSITCRMKWLVLCSICQSVILIMLRIMKTIQPGAGHVADPCRADLNSWLGNFDQAAV